MHCHAEHRLCLSYSANSCWGNPKYQPFWGSPLFYKAPARQFQPPKCKLTPSKRGCLVCSSKQKLQIVGRQFLFGGCRFTFWRVPIYILEAEIVLGVLYRKGGIPKKVGTLVSREVHCWVSPEPLRCDLASSRAAWPVLDCFGLDLLSSHRRGEPPRWGSGAASQHAQRRWVTSKMPSLATRLACPLWGKARSGERRATE